VAFEPGTRFGAYEVLALLGIGGMGEVYRARDTRLGRDVALKVLPDAFTHDADRVARFRREAQVLAALNHPHIAAIYGLEEIAGPASVHQALVLELVDGESLDRRIARERVAADEALAIARQIAEALEAAHDKGIVHRDLKPANVALTPDGTVKVLDFGLAKALDPTPAADVSMSPTLTFAGATQAGVILGTAAYMAPEQAKGRAADKRSDVWAFGCVLYEMLSGRRAFEGEDVSDTLAAVLRGEPEWAALPSDLPPAIRTLIEGCLRKDRRQRIGDMSTARFILDHQSAIAGSTPAVPAPPAPRVPAWRRALPAALTGIAMSAATALIVITQTRTAPTPIVARIPLTLPGDQVFSTPGRRIVDVSPDGSRIVYVANRRLYVRALSESEGRPLAGSASETGSMGFPAFSPDGQWIAYYAGDNTLKRIPVSGGTAVTICQAGVPGSVVWDEQGVMFSVLGRGISRVAASGGQPQILVSTQGAEVAAGGQLLPDGDSLLFAVATGAGSIARWDRAQVVVQSLKTGQRRTLIDGGADPRYLQSGHLVYALGGVLLAVPLDLKRLTPIGVPVAVVEGVARATTGAAHYAVSRAGTLIYVPGPPSLSFGDGTLALIDRQGGVSPLKLKAAPFQMPRLSPDGKRVAFGTDDGVDAAVSIYDLDGVSSARRLTVGGHNRFPVWSSDGTRVAFQSDREGDLGIFWQRADGVGQAERLTKAEKNVAHVPSAWMPHGDRLLFDVVSGGFDTLHVLSLPGKTIEPFAGVRSIVPINATFSPDGKWVAYTTRDVPTNGVPAFQNLFIQPMPPNGTIYSLSKSENAHYPVWTSGGKELFYIPGPSRLSRIDIMTAPTVTYSNAVDVPKAGFFEGGPAYVRSYDVTADGSRILAIVGLSGPGTIGTEAGSSSAQIEIVLNWLNELKQRVPTK
jgi:serine/threonine-protein kinase